jgi:hypothetical protein
MIISVMYQSDHDRNDLNFLIDVIFLTPIFIKSILLKNNFQNWFLNDIRKKWIFYILPKNPKICFIIIIRQNLCFLFDFIKSTEINQQFFNKLLLKQ